MNEEKTWIIERFDELESTQDYAKSKRDLGENRIVLARRQTKGKGTKGRSFESDMGGIYLSKLTFYTDFLAKKAFQIMASAATSVCVTLRRFGLKPTIKWPNDVFVNGKKICGILIENTLSGEKIRASVVGIGLNVNNGFSPALNEIAVNMQTAAGKSFSVEDVEACLLEELCVERSMEEYLSFVGYMGEKALLIFGDERIPGRLLSVDDSGGLWVEINGKSRRLTAAEVSFRIGKIGKDGF